MVQRFHLSAVVAGLFSISDHPTHADPDLEEVVGTRRAEPNGQAGGQQPRRRTERSG